MFDGGRWTDLPPYVREGMIRILADLLEARSYECYLTGEVEAALTDRAKAVELRRSTGNFLKTGDNLRTLSRFHWFAGHSAEAMCYAQEALDVLGAEQRGHIRPPDTE